MKLARSLLAGYLTLCLAGAGAVGISPLLHQLVEHGGHGPAHVHTSAIASVAELPAPKFRHDHGDGQFHEHTPAAAFGQRARANHGFAARHEFALPNISLVRVLHRLAAWLDGDAPVPLKSSSPQDGPGHSHHSLPQLLVGGVVELHVEVAPVGFVFAPANFLSVADHFPPLLHDWFAHAASRAPPSARG